MERTDEHHLGAGDEVGSGQLDDGLVPLARVVVEPVPVATDEQVEEEITVELLKD